MARQNINESIRPLIKISAGLLIIAALYFGQGVLVPIAIAILLSFMLAPVADAIERVHVPRLGSVILISAFAFTLLFCVGWLVASQVYSLADMLPKYQQNIEERLRFIQGEEGGTIEKAAETVKEASEEVAEEAQQEADDLESEQAAEVPIPVEIHKPPPSNWEQFKWYVLPVLAPVGKAGLVMIFVIFMLLQREDLRDRTIRLMGEHRLDVTTRAFNDAGARISRYLLMQLVINVTYGIPVAIGLWLIGVPGALLWGLLATLLRYIPYIGPWMAAIMPIVMSLAVFDGWYWPLAVVGLFIVLEAFSNNVMEPWLYGSSTGLSPVGVIITVVFWSALWGLIGLLVAIPLTVCLVVAGRYLPQFRFFTILLSREPALSPAERFYQRLLAGDMDEAEELAHDHAEEHGLMSLYDEMMVPAMHVAERNRHAGRLEVDEEEQLLDGMESIITDLGEWQKRALGQDAEGEAGRTDREASPVLCLAARDKADELAAVMFCQVLGAEGVAAEAVSVKALAGEVINRIDESHTKLVCISALPPGAVSRTRYLCQRLDNKFPDLQIFVGLWNLAGNLERMRARLTDAGADRVMTTFEDGVAQLRRILASLVVFSRES